MDSFTDQQDACTHATPEIWDGPREICSGLSPVDVACSVASVGVTDTI